MAPGSAAKLAVATGVLSIFILVGTLAGLPILDDVATSLFGLAVLLLALVLHRLHRERAPVVSAATVLLGLSAGMLLAGAHALSVAGAIPPVAASGVGLLAFAGVGAWLLGVGHLVRVARTFPLAVGLLAIPPGAGYLLGTLGFFLGGPAHPLALLGGLLGAVGYPAFAFRLARALTAAEIS